MIDQPTKKPRGGKRAGAGRKKTGKKLGGPHRRRPPLSSNHPVHVVMRVKKGVPKLRQRLMYQAIRRAMVRCVGKTDFRIVHISLQRNHLHLIVEAASKRALTLGMQSFTINAARAINSGWGREGKVFEFRYHATQIKTPQYARNALSYVLNNWRRHREDYFDNASQKARLDEYSSAISFTGWAGQSQYAIPDGYEPLPVEAPTTPMLLFDWTLYGLIGEFECPGPIQ